MQRGKAIALGLAAAAGLAAGIALGRHYYYSHYGDWRIGVTALGLGAGLSVGLPLLVACLWWGFSAPAGRNYGEQLVPPDPAASAAQLAKVPENVERFGAAHLAGSIDGSADGCEPAVDSSQYVSAAARAQAISKQQGDTSTMKGFGGFLNFVAGAVSIAAGIYLIAHHGAVIQLADGETATTWFQVLSRGIGVYFIARGINIIGIVFEGLPRQQETNYGQRPPVAPEAPRDGTPSPTGADLDAALRAAREDN